MFDRVDAPAFLIEHAVVNNAADGELAIGLDRIILEILVAAVAIDEQSPLRISLANPCEERHVYCRTVDV